MLKINIKIHAWSNRIVTALILSLFFVASSANLLSAQTVNQGFKSDEPLRKGMIVAAVEGDETKVEKGNEENFERLKGVVVQKNDSPVTLAEEGNNVFVANTGIYDVLVSDENGEIKSGDYLSFSSLEGIAMKATDEQAIIIGRASQGFNGRDNIIGSQEDKNTKRKVNFGLIKTAVGVGHNPWLRNEKGNTIPKIVERVTTTIAGKPVNTTRAWLATAVFLGTIFIVGVMLYSGSRSSLISVGRNPLSKGVIIKGLLQVVILSVAIFITGLFGVYLLLKL